MRNHWRGMIFGLAFAGVLAGNAGASAATATRVSAFTYDAATGLLTQETVEPDTAQLRLDTAYTIDAFGHRTATTVSSPATGQAAIVSRTSTVTYDGQGRFATGAANALSQSETRAFDSRFGQPTSLTGPNNLTTTWQYDVFGRKTLETRSDGTQTKFQYLFCSGFNGGTATCPTGAKYLVQATPYASDGVTQNGPFTKGYFDILNRQIQAETQGFDGTTIVAVTQYDSMGRVQQKSLPYFTGGTPKYVSYQYDVLGRPTRETLPDNSYTQYAYSGLTKTTTNSLNQTRTEIKNSQGLVITAKDTTNHTTTFTYDPFSNPVTTTDAAGNVTTISYDTRGRKTAMTDPDLGSWSYAYDVLGELVQQTDAKSQVTTFAYDKLGRPLTRTEPDLTSTWTYDTATKGVGKLATASGNNGYSRTQSYDSQGRPSNVLIAVDASNTYNIATTYDSNGHIATVAYPSGFAVKYQYTALGYLSQVRNNLTNALYWQVGTMNAEMQLTNCTFGNNLQSTWGYDPNTARLTSVQAGTNNAVQNMAFAYDTLGNLQNRSDLTQNVVENFQYDNLNRVTQAAIVSGSTKTYAYDSIGDITSKSDVGTYAYPTTGSARPHAVTSVTGTVNGATNPTFTYDANGNMLTGAGRTMTWTSYNMVASVTQGSNVLGYTYNTEHSRIIQTAPEGTTRYFNDSGSGIKVEKFTGTTGAVQWNDYIFAGGDMVAVYYERPASTNYTRYFHKDHLGSISVITDETGAVVERDAYDTWGKRRYPTGGDDTSGILTSLTTRGYTGQEHMPDVSLINYNGRIYDPQLGRFLSADPYVSNAINTQALNRYSYVQDNPLAYNDPNGFGFFDDLFDAIVGFFSNWQALVALVVAVVAIYALPAIEVALGASALATSAGATTLGVIVNAGIAGGIAGAISTGSLKGALIGAATAAAFAGIAQAAGPAGTALGTDQYYASIAGDAVVGCASAVAQGGECGPAAFSAAATAAVAPEVKDMNSLAERTAVSAIVGGTASVLGGGKFANGAASAAFQYLYISLAAAALGGSSRPTLTHEGGGNTAFVGGFFDYTIHGPAYQDYMDYVRLNPELGAAYFTWDQGDALAAWIDANDGAVTVVGHSYGADTAASVVAAGHPVMSLITVDPVSWFRPNYLAVAANILPGGTWANFDATSGQGSLANFIAGIGGPWDTGPQGYANRFRNIDLDHATIMRLCGMPGTC